MGAVETGRRRVTVAESGAGVLAVSSAAAGEPRAPYWYPLSVPTLGDDEVDAAVGVLRSGRTTMGDRVAEFEDRFAWHVGARHAVMVNSGSSADLLIAFALGADGGQVLVPAVTWPTHVWSWQMAGMDVRLADVDGINVTADTLWEASTPDTVGVSLAHLMGVPCDMAPIRDLCRERGWWLTEDCCEALGASSQGAPVGSAGSAAAWSFFFSHHMTTMEGGMVTCQSAALADRIRSLRSHGWARHLTHAPEGLDRRYTFVDWGFNVRPTEVAAAIGMVQVGKLARANHQRWLNQKAFARLLDGNPNVTIPEVPVSGRAAWFGLPILLNSRADRDGLAAYLEDCGVETRPILAGNLTRQPAFAKHPVSHPALPGADRVHDHGLYVGLHPTTCSGVERVASLIAGWCQ